VGKYEDLIAGDDALLAVTGRAWVFGDHVRRAHVLADEHLEHPPSVARQFALAGLDPRFAAHVAPGDFLVAGLAFAADASQPKIVAVLKSLGIGAVIARSFGKPFERNAIRAGLPVLVVEETAAIKAGDHLRVDVEAHIVANLSSGDRYVVRNLDDAAIALLRAGAR
jgi:3-isopropylmalate/(R)-2-methylmalate dehydratase small subunit